MSRLLSRIPVGIRFGDYVFADPVHLTRASLPPRSAGLYVVLMPDPSWGPWHFQPLFFGEFGGQRDAHMSVAQQVCCLKVAAGRSLFFGTLVVPQQYGWAIPQIKRELIERYHPVANMEPMDTSAELAHRFSSLEKRVIEQEAVFKLALATIGQMVQLQPEPKRRMIGFQPDPAGSRRGSPRKTQNGSETTAAGKPY